LPRARSDRHFRVNLCPAFALDGLGDWSSVRRWSERCSELYVRFSPRTVALEACRSHRACVVAAGRRVDMIVVAMFGLSDALLRGL
jgi:hypothetical protein